MNLSIHNCTVVTNIRINKQDHPDSTSGWVVIDMGAEQYSWGDEKQETVSNEVTFFFRDLELGLAQLRTQLDKGILAMRLEEVEKIQKAQKEKENV